MMRYDKGKTKFKDITHSSNMEQNISTEQPEALGASLLVSSSYSSPEKNPLQITCENINPAKQKVHVSPEAVRKISERCFIERSKTIAENVVLGPSSHINESPESRINAVDSSQGPSQQNNISAESLANASALANKLLQISAISFPGLKPGSVNSHDSNSDSGEPPASNSEQPRHIEECGPSIGVKTSDVIDTACENSDNSVRSTHLDEVNSSKPEENVCNLPVPIDDRTNVIPTHIQAGFDDSNKDVGNTDIESIVQEAKRSESMDIQKSASETLLSQSNKTINGNEKQNTEFSAQDANDRNQEADVSVNQSVTEKNDPCPPDESWKETTPAEMCQANEHFKDKTVPSGDGQDKSVDNEQAVGGSSRKARKPSILDVLSEMADQAGIEEASSEALPSESWCSTSVSSNTLPLSNTVDQTSPPHQSLVPPPVSDSIPLAANLSFDYSISSLIGGENSQPDGERSLDVMDRSLDGAYFNSDKSRTGKKSNTISKESDASANVLSNLDKTDARAEINQHTPPSSTSHETSISHSVQQQSFITGDVSGSLNTDSTTNFIRHNQHLPTWGQSSAPAPGKLSENNHRTSVSPGSASYRQSPHTRSPSAHSSPGLTQSHSVENIHRASVSPGASFLPRQSPNYQQGISNSMSSITSQAASMDNIRRTSMSPGSTSFLTRRSPQMQSPGSYSNMSSPGSSARLPSGQSSRPPSVDNMQRMHPTQVFNNSSNQNQIAFGNNQSLQRDSSNILNEVQDSAMANNAFPPSSVSFNEGSLLQLLHSPLFPDGTTLSDQNQQLPQNNSMQIPFALPDQMTPSFGQFGPHSQGQMFPPNMTVDVNSQTQFNSQFSKQPSGQFHSSMNASQGTYAANNSINNVMSSSNRWSTSYSQSAHQNFQDMQQSNFPPTNTHYNHLRQSLPQQTNYFQNIRMAQDPMHQNFSGLSSSRPQLSSQQSFHQTFRPDNPTKRLSHTSQPRQRQPHDFNLMQQRHSSSSITQRQPQDQFRQGMSQMQPGILQPDKPQMQERHQRPGQAPPGLSHNRPSFTQMQQQRQGQSLTRQPRPSRPQMQLHRASPPNTNQHTRMNISHMPQQRPAFSNQTRAPPQQGTRSLQTPQTQSFQQKNQTNKPTSNSNLGPQQSSPIHRQSPPVSQHSSSVPTSVNSAKDTSRKNSESSDKSKSSSNSSKEPLTTSSGRPIDAETAQLAALVVESVLRGQPTTHVEEQIKLVNELLKKKTSTTSTSCSSQSSTSSSNSSSNTTTSTSTTSSTLSAPRSSTSTASSSSAASSSETTSSNSTNLSTSVRSISSTSAPSRSGRNRQAEMFVDLTSDDEGGSSEMERLIVQQEGQTSGQILSLPQNNISPLQHITRMKKDALDIHIFIEVVNIKSECAVFCILERCMWGTCGPKEKKHCKLSHGWWILQSDKRLSKSRDEDVAYVAAQIIARSQHDKSAFRQEMTRILDTTVGKRCEVFRNVATATVKVIGRAFVRPRTEAGKMYLDSVDKNQTTKNYFEITKTSNLIKRAKEVCRQSSMSNPPNVVVIEPLDNETSAYPEHPLPSPPPPPVVQTDNEPLSIQNRDPIVIEPPPTPAPPSGMEAPIVIAPSPTLLPGNTSEHEVPIHQIDSTRHEQALRSLAPPPNVAPIVIAPQVRPGRPGRPPNILKASQQLQQMQQQMQQKNSLAPPIHKNQAILPKDPTIEKSNRNIFDQMLPAVLTGPQPQGAQTQDNPTNPLSNMRQMQTLMTQPMTAIRHPPSLQIIPNQQVPNLQSPHIVTTHIHPAFPNAAAAMTRLASQVNNAPYSQSSTTRPNPPVEVRPPMRNNVAFLPGFDLALNADSSPTTPQTPSPSIIGLPVSTGPIAQATHPKTPGLMNSSQAITTVAEMMLPTSTSDTLPSLQAGTNSEASMRPTPSTTANATLSSTMPSEASGISALEAQYQSLTSNPLNPLGNLSQPKTAPPSVKDNQTLSATNKSTTSKTKGKKKKSKQPPSSTFEKPAANESNKSRAKPVKNNPPEYFTLEDLMEINFTADMVPIKNKKDDSNLSDHVLALLLDQKDRLNETPKKRTLRLKLNRIEDEYEKLGLKKLKRNRYRIKENSALSKPKRLNRRRKLYTEDTDVDDREDPEWNPAKKQVKKQGRYVEEEIEEESEGSDMTSEYNDSGISDDGSWRRDDDFEDSPMRRRKSKKRRRKVIRRVSSSSEEEENSVHKQYAKGHNTPTKSTARSKRRISSSESEDLPSKPLLKKKKVSFGDTQKWDESHPHDPVFPPSPEGTPQKMHEKKTSENSPKDQPCEPSPKQQQPQETSPKGLPKETSPAKQQSKDIDQLEEPTTPRRAIVTRVNRVLRSSKAKDVGTIKNLFPQLQPVVSIEALTSLQNKSEKPQNTSKQKGHKPKPEESETKEIKKIDLKEKTSQKATGLDFFTNEQLWNELTKRQELLTCDCGLTFVDKKLYQYHRASHDSENPMKCTACAVTFKDWMSFTSHSYNTHWAKPKTSTSSSSKEKTCL